MSRTTIMSVGPRFPVIPGRKIYRNQIFFVISVSQDPISASALDETFQPAIRISLYLVRFAALGRHIAIAEHQDDGIQLPQIRAALSHPFPALDIFGHLDKPILRFTVQIISDRPRVLKAHVAEEFRIGIQATTFADYRVDQLSFVTCIIVQDIP